MIRKFLLSFSLFLISPLVHSQVQIQGHTKLDQSWRKQIYASRIPTLNDFYRCAESLIIASSQIDSSGQWELEIPADSVASIFRIHISKMTYPAASLIIGGEDHNHAFIAVGHALELQYRHHGEGLLSDFACESDPLNRQMKIIQEFFDASEGEYENAVQQEDKLRIRINLAQDLLSMAETVTNILPAMYAAHLADMGFNKEEVHRTMRSIESRFGKHPYLATYQLAGGRSGTAGKVMIISGFLLSVYLLFRIALWYRQQQRRKLINSLSTRELEVFTLVVEGKSNKELAEKLNVELSTVKSHLHRIYNKLKVSSRNQLRRFS